MPNLSDSERLGLKRKIRRDVRTTFSNMGFMAVAEDFKINLCGQESDLDNVFVFENLILIVEDTTTSDTDHLRKKAEFFTNCKNNQNDLIELFKSKIPNYGKNSTAGYASHDIKLAFLYVSHEEVTQSLRDRYQHLHFMDYKSRSYFLSLSKTIKRSARFELFKFIGVGFEEIGPQNSGSPGDDYVGLILPETPSGFPSGHNLVSFLIDPNTLLKQAYVLRRDGWQDSDFVYQRIILGNKIRNMRKYLASEGRVFVNNIIVSLPNDLQLLEYESNDRINLPISTGVMKDPIKIRIPKVAGNIGIIDGQHRVFSYHEGDDAHDTHISSLRDKQHLLITGIVFPSDLSLEDRGRFEAKLFLEINDRQTRTSGSLRQVINTIVNPFDEVSIAKKVMNKLAELDPMDKVLERHFFDKGKLKTTSIVSYGVRHVVKLSGKDTLFNVWSEGKKSELRDGKDTALLNEYVEFCTKEINEFLKAFKNQIPNDMWTTKQKVSRALTVTTITGLIHCMRILIENNKVNGFAYYDKGFSKLSGKIDFSTETFNYKSSHWKDLGDEIYNVCFTDTT